MLQLYSMSGQRVLKCRFFWHPFLFCLFDNMHLRSVFTNVVSHVKAICNKIEASIEEHVRKCGSKILALLNKTILLIKQHFSVWKNEISSNYFRTLRASKPWVFGLLIKWQQTEQFSGILWKNSMAWECVC